MSAGPDQVLSQQGKWSPKCTIFIPKLRPVSYNPRHFFWEPWEQCQKAACAQCQPFWALTIPTPISLAPQSLLSRRYFWPRLYTSRSLLALVMYSQCVDHWKYQTFARGEKIWCSPTKAPNRSILLKEQKQTKIHPKSSQSCPVLSPFRDPSHKSTEAWTWGKSKVDRRTLDHPLPNFWSSIDTFWHFCWISPFFFLIAKWLPTPFSAQREEMKPAVISLEISTSLSGETSWAGATECGPCFSFSLSFLFFFF